MVMLRALLNVGTSRPLDAKPGSKISRNDCSSLNSASAAIIPRLTARFRIGEAIRKLDW